VLVKDLEAGDLVRSRSWSSADKTADGGGELMLIVSVTPATVCLESSGAHVPGTSIAFLGEDLTSGVMTCWWEIGDQIVDSMIEQVFRDSELIYEGSPVIYPQWETVDAG
jgi:hypothetical protein